MIGNLVSKLTPKDARGINLSKYIVHFISGYRGGRNESMMYGYDNVLEHGRSYYDYDMTSAYTTVMSILGHPEYNYARRIFDNDVKEMYDKDPKQFLFNYVVLDVKFKFEDTVKYPCIPARVDENSDIYPLSGSGVITGPEYLVARSMGCEITIKEGVEIPFKSTKPAEVNKEENKVELLQHHSKNVSKMIKSEVLEKLKDKQHGGKSRKETVKETDVESLFDYEAPFRQIIKELQQKRREHEKYTFHNYMYKEIGNSIYGLVAMGLSGKTSYDIKTKTYLRVDGGILSNPVLASYITGFCRAFIGECLNNVQLLNGYIVSVTTDGFISDLEDLEKKILGLGDSNLYCFKVYKQLRKLLTKTEEGFDDSALEVKNVESKGLIT